MGFAAARSERSAHSKFHGTSFMLCIPANFPVKLQYDYIHRLELVHSYVGYHTTVETKGKGKKKGQEKRKKLEQACSAQLLAVHYFCLSYPSSVLDDHRTYFDVKLRV
eukprot:scaffold11034_cov155-Skeletonema_dohrnii-CCMP3373.AAC.8